ncbi:tetratricopeptide repeat protein [Culturomica massiliensis]|uniref:tetratricopeptide repeat protein n=1 Tax=Culturomica massiliensis TaxID=1841857 RepID=UPI003AB59FBB
MGKSICFYKNYYPSAANLYDSLGELYERRQQLKAARRCYRQALKIARKDKDMILMLPAYEAHLKGVK